MVDINNITNPPGPEKVPPTPRGSKKGNSGEAPESKNQATPEPLPGGPEDDDGPSIAVSDKSASSAEDAAQGEAVFEGPSEEELAREEAEYARLRQDLPNAEGASARGIVTINAEKNPGRNEFFRSHPDFCPVIYLVTDAVALDTRFYAVDPSMTHALQSIHIDFALHTLYLTLTAGNTLRVIPVRCPGPDGERNEYNSTKELALRTARKRWVRMYTDRENSCYRVFPAPIGRFPEPVFPRLTEARIVRLAFRDKGRLIDTEFHPRFQAWAGRKDADGE
jgi:hypothetical protein